MMPFACPMMTRLPEVRLDSRSNPRPPLLRYQGLIGSPRSPSCSSRRRFACSVLASFSSAMVSSAAGDVRVRRHEKHLPAGASSRTSQLHAHPLLEQVYQVTSSMIALSSRMPTNCLATKSSAISASQFGHFSISK